MSFFICRVHVPRSGPAYDDIKERNLMCLIKAQNHEDAKERCLESDEFDDVRGMANIVVKVYGLGEFWKDVS